MFLEFRISLSLLVNNFPKIENRKWTESKLFISRFSTFYSRAKFALANFQQQNTFRESKIDQVDIFLESRLSTFGQICLANLAERPGFEPGVQFPVQPLSRRLPSATRPPLRKY